MTRFDGDLKTEFDRLNQAKLGSRRGFTFIVRNETDEWVTESYFGIEYDTGGGEIHGGEKIAPRSTWQRSIDVVPCASIATASLWFGDELVKCEPIHAKPGHCLISVSWLVGYQNGNLKTSVFLGENKSVKK